MKAQAHTKGIRISTRKVRLVADSIRNLPVNSALKLLLTTRKHGASVLIKTLKSAIANALQKPNVKEEDLVIDQIQVDGGPTLRRMHIGSRSHVRLYTKRSSHIRIVLTDERKNAEPEIKNEKMEKKEETK